jgi:hypothetical protein
MWWVMWWHRLALLHLLGFYLMGYLALESRALGSPTQRNTYTQLYICNYNLINFTILKLSDWE